MSMIVSDKIKTFIFPDMVLFDRCFYYIASIIDSGDENRKDIVKKGVHELDKSFFRMTGKHIYDLSEDRSFIKDLLIGSMLRDTYDIGIDIKNDIKFDLDVFRLGMTHLIFNESLFIDGGLSKIVYVICKDEMDVELLLKLNIPYIEHINIIDVKKFLEMTTKDSIPIGDILEFVIGEPAMVDLCYNHLKEIASSKQAKVKIIMPEIPMALTIDERLKKEINSSGIDLYYYSL